MAQNSKVRLDQLDLAILREMETDGRQPLSDLAKKLGTSRANTSRKLKRLLDSKVTRIVAFTNPLVLGYRTNAMIGIKVSPREIHETAEKLTALHNVHLVIIAAGRHDILIWTMFQTPTDLSTFLGRDLGMIPSITSTETMIVLETRKQSFDFLASSNLVVNDGKFEERFSSEELADQDAALAIDHLDLMILKELEIDARQSVSDLAKKLGTSRGNVSNKLQRLLNQQLTKIVAFTNPLTLGYNVFSLTGIKVSPNEIDAAAERLSRLPEVHTVAKVAGRYDIVVQTMFHTPIEQSAFLLKELSNILGITFIETMIALELRKLSFMFLVSSHLEAKGDLIKPQMILK